LSAFSTSFRFLLIAALTVASLPAYAQDSDDRAYELATEGAKLFGAGDYREAARRFEEAYSLLKDSVLLKNQIVSLYKAGDCGSALDLAYQYDISYRDAPPTDREDVRKVRVDCNLLAAETALEYGKLDVVDESLQRAKAIGVQGDEEKRYRALNDQLTIKRQPKPVAPIEEVEDPNSWRPIVGWSLSGVGLAVVGITGVLQYGDYQRGIELGCATKICTTERPEYDELKNNGTTYAIGYGIGGVMLVSGAGLLVYHYLIDTDEKTVLLAPTLGSSAVGASLQFKF
jgi:tetratricopeptide (TPR) repeat protein